MEHPTPSDEWQGERLHAYREALEARRVRQVMAGRLFVAALVLTLATSVALRLPESWWIPAVGGFAALAMVFRLANWKCPSCGERISGRAAGASCLGCGAPLD
jgi:apolipoprotein N-acyltransferase